MTQGEESRKKNIGEQCVPVFVGVWSVASVARSLNLGQGWDLKLETRLEPSKKDSVLCWEETHV